jgi:putative PIN family toxin of toxin-antitoxin system
MRAAVDTNVWTRAFLNVLGPAGQITRALLEGRFTLVTSEALLDELTDVLSRPRLVRRHRRNSTEIAHYVDALRDGGEIVVLTGAVHVCRDPDDDVLVETAERGRVDCLVSEDQDLHAREVRDYLSAAGIRVFTVREFLAELDARAEQPTP